MKLLAALMVLGMVSVAQAHEVHPVAGNVFGLTKGYVMNSFEIGYSEEAYPGRSLRDRIWSLRAPLMQFHRRAYMDTTVLFANGLRKASLDFPLIWSKDVTVTPSVSYLKPIDAFGFGFTAKIKLR